jgi:hypothetical protein
MTQMARILTDRTFFADAAHTRKTLSVLIWVIRVISGKVFIY